MYSMILIMVVYIVVWKILTVQVSSYIDYLNSLIAVLEWQNGSKRPGESGTILYINI